MSLHVVISLDDPGFIPPLNKVIANSNGIVTLPVVAISIKVLYCCPRIVVYCICSVHVFFAVPTSQRVVT